MFGRSKTRIIVDEKDDQIYIRNVALVASFFIIALLIIALIVFPRFIRISYPPDTSMYQEQSIGTIEKHEVYGYTFMVWQTLNTWRGNDKKYRPENQLARLQCFVSEQFYIDMEAQNLAEKDKRQGRSRSLSTLSDAVIKQNTKVIPLGGNEWDVTLDVRLNESRKGIVIKDAVPMRYKFRVVADNSENDCNPWGLKLTSMLDKPRRIYFQNKG